MVPQWVIEKKRDGLVLADEEICGFVNGFTSGAIPDYQMAALAMAIYFQGMNDGEITALTGAMMRSGETISLLDNPRPTADKHSTGGIGDKVSLILAPLAAAAGMAAPMIAGRGLGITGGTLDKLESIRGFNVRLSIADFRRIIATTGCAIIGQTDRLVPADRKLYALRDVTGTVPSIPLITASIMSKKLAVKTHALVLDVKCGRGAFMRTPAAARDLAVSLLRVGHTMKRKMTALVTNMDRPLGRAVGNALEVREAIETLRGGGPGDIRALTIELAASMGLLSGIYTSRAMAVADLSTKLDNGAALAAFRAMVQAQGGDIDAVDHPETSLPRAAACAEITAPVDGWVTDVDPEVIGRAALLLGAGRQRSDSAIDHAAGIDSLAQCGEKVTRGQPLMRLHAASVAIVAAARPHAEKAVTIGDAPAAIAPLIIQRFD